jgi:allantoate deiminase
MEAAGMSTRIDNAGNLRATRGESPKLLIGSHLDTVPNAGRYDGVLGVVMALTLAELVSHPLEAIGFSEEEGVRFGTPFIGSRAYIGEPVERDDINEAIRAYGLNPHTEPVNAKAYLEFHIEQGPVLESLDLPLGIVDAIAGQSRLDLTFHGQSNHAGTTPMALRHDALAAAAEWISAVEAEARETPGLVATVGHIEAQPNVRNAINDSVLVSLDVRHADDRIRHDAVDRLIAKAKHRDLEITIVTNLNQSAVPMDARLSEALAGAVASTGRPVHRLTSGAGHDAMIVAQRLPVAMLFLRSPGGISHHPDEAVLVEDVAAALEAGVEFLQSYEGSLV